MNMEEKAEEIKKGSEITAQKILDTLNNIDEPIGTTIIALSVAQLSVFDSHCQKYPERREKLLEFLLDVQNEFMREFTCV
jgi:hypothetical protein